jgi:hypothetical protein
VPRWPLAAAGFALAPALALAACGDEGARAPGEVSAGEAKAIEDAAEMLDQRRLPPGALPPEAASTAPPATPRPPK